MSLTSFLAQRDVRAAFRREFVKPRLPNDKPLLAAPLSKRYALVGTAFDYLLRFYLERRHPNAKHDRWVAEAGLERLTTLATTPLVYDVDTEQFAFPDDKRTVLALSILKRGRRAHARYIKSGRITDALLKATMGLAQLDVVYRSGFVDENLGVAYSEDVRDLRKLISLIRPALFRASTCCLLNPAFGAASRLVGGADADLIIDDMLIEIKVTKACALQREHFNQLMGYAILDRLAARGRRARPAINRIGIYYARYGELVVFELRHIINPRTYPAFVRWFVRRTGRWRLPRRRLARTVTRGAKIPLRRRTATVTRARAPSSGKAR